MRDDALGAVGGAGGDELADLGVLAGAHRLRQRRVGDVADQHVLERVLALAGQAAAGGRHDEVLAAQRLERRPQVEARLARVADGALPEGLADHRGRLQDPALGARQRVEPRREHRVHGLGQRLGVAGALLDDPVDHLLGEQRVAARALGDLLGELGSARRPRRRAARRPARGSGRGRAGRGVIVVALRRPPPQPGRRSSSSSRARQTISTGPRTQRARCSIRSSIPSSAQWMSSTAKTSGCAAAAGLDHGPHRGEQALAHLLRVVVLDARPSAVPPAGSIPSGRPSAAASRSAARRRRRRRSAPRSRRGACARPSSVSSVSTISNVPRTISPSAQ